MAQKTDSGNEGNSAAEVTEDGVDRRGFLKCMLWAGAGVVWTVQGGILSSSRLGAAYAYSDKPRSASDLHFVQISDSHIGFKKPANTDVTGTLIETVARINALPHAPEFFIHTGDISHLAKPDQFDTATEILKGVKAPGFYVPGEHDVEADTGNPYQDRHGKGTLGDGWYSFDQKGVHFVGLVNVVNFKAGGLGALGQPQIDWLKQDLRGLTSSTPLVVFAHIPLWTVYPDWGWGTADSEQALSLMRRFGSVTVLNGHIHQALQKIEGNITFHTATSTAFPQPAPGKAAGPGPLVVPADRLKSLLGLTQVTYVENRGTLALVDQRLGAAPPTVAETPKTTSAE